MSTPRASIIISTWNGRHLLETCLPRVLRAVEEAEGEHEVIVVDDASEDDTVEYVRRTFPQVKLLPLPRNLRFAGANNAAARIASGEFLVFLNNDMLVEPDFLDPLLAPFADPAVFAVTAHIHMPPKRAGGREIRETGLVRARFENGFFVLQHQDTAAREPIPVMYAGGGSSAWRRDRFFQLGCFDRLFRPFYFEDLDVSYRAQKAGWKVLFAPGSHVVHQHQQTNNPRNFPPGYVQQMFGKNNLLFTWKVLTDRAMLNEHFRRLWGLMMRPRLHPELPCWFLRAAWQLPELLVARHRARPHMRLSDAEVLRFGEETGGAAQAEETPAPAARPGRGKRILVLGFGPLPFEKARLLNPRAIRTWHVAEALAADGHEVTLVACRTPDSYLDGAARAPVLRFGAERLIAYSATSEVLEQSDFLQRMCDRTHPEAIVSVHAYSGWLASRLDTEAPLWADLTPCATSEAQARVSPQDRAAAMARTWEWERAALARADSASVVSERQGYAVLGELAAIGRMGDSATTQGFLHHIPCAIESAPYRHDRRVLRGRAVGEDDFVILWSGGYDAGCDVETLFDGVAAAMRQEPRVKFVSIGGARPGEDDDTYYRFRCRAEESDLASRFTFLGWVLPGEVPSYYFESDVGIVIERDSPDLRFGCRYRLLDMMRAGMPVVCTQGSEISEVIREQHLGLTPAPGSAEEVTEAILSLARDESLRRRYGERARQWVFKQRPASRVMAPLRAWARNPQSAADRGRVTVPVSRGWQPRGRLARFLQLWETQGRRATVRTVLGGAVSMVADLAARALVRRRKTAAWGLDPTEPPQSMLVIRAGEARIMRELVERVRAHYPEVKVTAVTPEELAEETRCETDARVIAAPGAGGTGYRITRRLLRTIHGGEYDTVVVAGEGNRRAELLAMLAGLARRVEVREDGAAHTFAFAPYKPLALLALGVLGVVEKVVLTALTGLVWSALRVEGKVWQVRMLRRGAARGEG